VTQELQKERDFNRELRKRTKQYKKQYREHIAQLQTQQDALITENLGAM
jgi:hypothetical protein